jgi:putative ABC transport system substrate-binding protein
VKKIRHLPIVFSSVTDPVSEGIVPKRSLPGTRSGTNVTGTSDRWPVQAQFEMYVRFFPKARKWGTLFNAGDPGSILHIQEMRATAKKLAIELVEATASSKSDILKATQTLAGKVQAINITFDITVLSSFEVVVKVCNEKKVPLFVGDLDKVPGGAIASYGSSYFDVGYFAGKKAVRILRGERPKEISWGPVEKLSLAVNEKAAKAQGVVIPARFLKKADRVIRE